MSETDTARLASERFAYVTLVTSDGYVDGALVLLHSLRRTLTPHSILCLVTPQHLSEHSLTRLRHHFDGVIETDVRLSTDDQGLALLGRPDLRSTLTKIQLWDPALFGAWDAVCYLDADTLVRLSIDDIFLRYASWREATPQWREGGLVAASPDTGWPDCFNSGVLLLAPGYECYRSLVHRANDTSSASFDGADQGLLNEQFSDWSAAPSYRRLPFLYNATANVYYTYKPALTRFGHDVRVVHFIGISKPWHWERSPGGQLHSDSSTSERWRQLISLWWNIHDEHVSGWKYWRGPFDKYTALGNGIGLGLRIVFTPLTTHILYRMCLRLLIKSLVTTTNTAAAHGTISQAHTSTMFNIMSTTSNPITTTTTIITGMLNITTMAMTSSPENRTTAVMYLMGTPMKVLHTEMAAIISTTAIVLSIIMIMVMTMVMVMVKHPRTTTTSIAMTMNSSIGHLRLTIHRNRLPGCNRRDPGRMLRARDGFTMMSTNRTLMTMHMLPIITKNMLMAIQIHLHSIMMSTTLGMAMTTTPTTTTTTTISSITIRTSTSTMTIIIAGLGCKSHGIVHMISITTTTITITIRANKILQPRGYEHDTGNYGHHGNGNDGSYYQDDRGAQRVPSVHSSRSNTGSSPLHYPQPKSPKVVNPVALWESEKDQAQRRAWAQQVRGVAPAEDQGSEHYAGTTDAQWFSSTPNIEKRTLPSSMDQIDSSQLPPETPWKISHVRQRPKSDFAGSASPHVSQPHAGIQFKEGVANDTDVRDAAGQLLRRWNEAIIARDIRPQADSAGWGQSQPLHSVPKVEQGTDTIRLETTVSCEVEDAKGERTVYRFTLSSTLDVGGAQSSAPGEPSSAPVVPTVRTGAIPMPRVPSDNHDYGEVTDLNQPINYKEPALSKRSSFVHLPPNSSRVLPAPFHGDSENHDQFAEADARYWRLQRQLIDLEMSQNRRGSEPFGESLANRPNDANRWDRRDDEDIDLESPPTPTRKIPSMGFGAPGNWKPTRRPSAFSIADPSTLIEQKQAEEAQVNAGHVPTNGTYTVLSSAIPPGADQIRSENDGRASGSQKDLRVRSQSDAQLFSSITAESAMYHEPTSLLASTDRSGVSHITTQQLASTPTAPNALSPVIAKRSRSYSALRRIAQENHAQAVVLPQKLKEASVGFGASSLVDSSSVDSDSKRPIFDQQVSKVDDSMADSSDDACNSDLCYASAVGRKPTPFPRSLRKDDASNSEEESGNGDVERQSEDVPGAAQQEKLRPLQIERPADGFGPAQVDMSPLSSGTPMTPGKQKIRPVINWGDDDNSVLPPDDDRSLDAQWLRIINGAPPARAPVVVPESTVAFNKQKAKQQHQPSPPLPLQSNPISETMHASVGGAESPMEINIDELEAATKESITGSSGDLSVDQSLDNRHLESELEPEHEPEHMSLDEEAVQEEAGGNKPAAAAAGARAPPRKLHSTRSFLNLNSKVYAIEDDESDLDPSEAELEARFWARAMKQPKSGISTPYTPSRRKSIVEMSKSISPKDLEEWMHWQGDHDPDNTSVKKSDEADVAVTGKPDDEQAESESVLQAGKQLDPITPPVSKERTAVGEPQTHLPEDSYPDELGNYELAGGYIKHGDEEYQDDDISDDGSDNLMIRHTSGSKVHDPPNQQFVRSRSDVMATAGLDRTVRLWNAESLFSHESEAQQLAIFDGLVSKPDTLATPETLPVVYFDDGKDIVACALD
ncbi:glycogenin glucosyltransferase [Coemansia sp. Benny D115]|nr:glycogenin glucosyltransferase [Coemansia sp. Benny D115]